MTFGKLLCMICLVINCCTIFFSLQETSFLFGVIMLISLLVTLVSRAFGARKMWWILALITGIAGLVLNGFVLLIGINYYIFGNDVITF